MEDDAFMAFLTDNTSDDNDIIVRQSNLTVLDDRLDTRLRAQRNIDEKWEELMVAGPLIINYLGNLMVLSSQQDFGFTLPSPNYVYEFIKYPNSFKATLAHLSHDMYDALLAAHTSMDRIQTFSSQIPTHINNTLKLVTRASPNMIKALLPNNLASITRIADICVNASSETVEKFAKLQKVIEEIIRVILSTQTANTNLVSQLQQQINNGTNEIQLLTANVTSIKQLYDEKRKALEKAREEYWNAVNALPTPHTRKSWFGGIVGSVWNAVTAPIQVVGCILGQCSGNNNNPMPAPADNTAFENAMAIAKLKLEELKRAEAEHDEYFQKQLGEQYKLAALIQQIASLNLDLIEPEKIVEILKQAFQEIQNLKTQWSEVRQFFESLSLQADSTKEIISSQFVNVIEKALAANASLQDGDREFFVELVLTAAETIDGNAALLYIMAKTYYDISRLHMLHQISGIGRLLGLNDTNQRRQELRNLQNETLVTSTKVTNMVQERQLAYKRILHARQQQLETFLLDATMNQLQSNMG
ncbi:unnamed protein product [Adineta ricciae]|uniref:Uncharacterized protein n=1 Tax=Adineta ricciae TaxID=249248 RepID=A0A814T3C5_ADIRI|nr:unnamed protein product [Adineta ricciae]